MTMAFLFVLNPPEKPCTKKKKKKERKKEKVTINKIYTDKEKKKNPPEIEKWVI